MYRHADFLCAVVDADGILQSVNPAWERRLGWPVDDFVGTPLSQWVLTEHHDELERLRAEAAEDAEDAAEVPVELKQRLGDPHWYSLRLVADVEEGVGLLYGHDVTSWKRQEALLAHQSSLEDVVARSATCLLSADSDHLDAAIDEVLADLGGTVDGDRTYVFLHDLLGSRTSNTHEWCDHDVEPQKDALQDVAIDAFPVWMATLDRDEVVLVSDLAELPREASAEREVLAIQSVVSVAAVPIRIDGTTVGFLGVDIVAPSPRRRWDDDTVAALRDIATALGGALARRRQQDELTRTARVLARRNDELARSNADLENFAYVASHDLRAPLTLLSGAVEMLQGQLEGQITDDQAELLGIASRNSARLARLVEDLLAFARVGDQLNTTEEIDLGAAVRESVTTLDSESDDVAADHFSVGDLPTVDGDPGLLRQVIDNLLSNAVKFRRPDEEPDVRISAERRGPDWAISVDDNGIGIPAEDRDRVFQMFTRLHRHAEYPGTGIGLSICARVVELHGGRIWVDDSDRGGTRITFTLPSR